jgi:hypothetical protein
MDGSHFDTLVKTLVTTRLTRLQTLRGLAAAGVVALTGITRLSEEAGAKKNHEGKIRFCHRTSATDVGVTKRREKSRAKKGTETARVRHAGPVHRGVDS